MQSSRFLNVLLWSSFCILSPRISGGKQKAGNKSETLKLWRREIFSQILEHRFSREKDNNNRQFWKFRKVLQFFNSLMFSKSSHHMHCKPCHILAFAWLYHHRIITNLTNNFDRISQTSLGCQRTNTGKLTSPRLLS